MDYSNPMKKLSRSDDSLVTINQNWNNADSGNDKFHSRTSSSDSSSDSSSSETSSSSDDEITKKKYGKKKTKKFVTRKKSESVGLSSSESSCQESYSKKSKAWKHSYRDNETKKPARKGSTFSVTEQSLSKDSLGPGPIKLKIVAETSTPQLSSPIFRNPLDTGQENKLPAVNKTAGFHSIQRILMAKEKRNEINHEANAGDSTGIYNNRISQHSSSRVGPRVRPTAIVRHSSPSTDSSRSASLERWTTDKDFTRSSHFEGFAERSTKGWGLGSQRPLSRLPVVDFSDKGGSTQTEPNLNATWKSTKEVSRQRSKEKCAPSTESLPSFHSDGEGEQRTRKPRLSRDSVSSLSSGICQHSSIVKAIQDGINAAMLLKAYQEKESEVIDRKVKSSHKSKKHDGRRSKFERRNSNRRESDKGIVSPSGFKGRDFDSGSISSNSSKKGFSPVFPLERRRKRKKKGKVKGFKTKHKNIYDPEFLKDLETIISRVSQIPVGCTPGLPRLPAIFQRRNYVCPSLLSKRRYANVIRPPICRSFPTPSPVYFDTACISQSCTSKKPNETPLTRPDSASTRYSLTSNLYDFVSSDEESPVQLRTPKISSPGSFSSGASPYGPDKKVGISRPSPLSKDDCSVKSKGDSPSSSKSFERSANALIAELEDKFKNNRSSVVSKVAPVNVSVVDDEVPLSVRKERRKSGDVPKGEEIVKDAIAPSRKTSSRKLRRKKIKVNEAKTVQMDIDSHEADEFSKQRLYNAEHRRKDAENQESSKDELCEPSKTSALIDESLTSPQKYVGEVNSVSDDGVNTAQERLRPNLRSHPNTAPVTAAVVEGSAIIKRRGRPGKRKSESEQLIEKNHINEAIESVILNSSEINGISPESGNVGKTQELQDGAPPRTRVRRKKEEPSTANKEEIDDVEQVVGEMEFKKSRVERKRGEKIKKMLDEPFKDGEKSVAVVVRRRAKKTIEDETVKINTVEQHLPLKKRHHHLTEAKADSPKSNQLDGSVEDSSTLAQNDQPVASGTLQPSPEDVKGKRNIKRRVLDPDPSLNNKMISPKKRHLLQPQPESSQTSCDLVENHIQVLEEAPLAPMHALPDVIPILNPVPKIMLKITNVDGAPQVTSLSMKKTKRKKINRTGFPNKKKKKRIEPTVTESESDMLKTSSSVTDDMSDAKMSSKEVTSVVVNSDRSARTSRKMAKVKAVKISQLRRRRIVQLRRPLRNRASSEHESLTEELLPVQRSLRSRIISPAPGAASILSDVDESRRRLSESPSKLPLCSDANDRSSGLLPLPLHSTRWLCSRKLDYHLSYECWSMKREGTLPKKPVSSWSYKKIRNNVYYDVKPPVDKEIHICLCKPPTSSGGIGCVESCLNRVCYTECLPSHCPVGLLCSNQRIQKHQWVLGLQRFMTKEKGFGIKTKQSIKTGEFIVEYTGEVVSEKEFRDRMTGIYVNDVHHYCLNLDGGLVIDGHRMGSEARFINHSCSPNCEIQKWNVSGLSRMCVFALRDIEPGEELTYDYNFFLFNPDEGQTCRCEATECRGVIGGKSQRMTNGISLGPVINTRSGKAIKTKGELKAMPKSPPKQLLKRQRNRISEEDKSLQDVRRLQNQYLKPFPVLCQNDIPCIKEKRCFLIRNYEKVRKKQLRLIQRADPAASKAELESPYSTRRRRRSSRRNSISKNLTHDSAKENIKPESGRRLEFPNLDYTIDNATPSEDSLAAVFLRIVKKILSLKDGFGTPIVNLLADSENSFKEIAQKVQTCHLSTPADFDSAIRDIFKQLFIMFPLSSVLGQMVAKLRKTYYEAKHCEYKIIETLIESGVPASFISDGHPDINLPEEEVVLCLCGLPHEEGLMVQCENCETWQHASCVQVANPEETYNCFKCTRRFTNRNRCVVIQPQPEDPPPGHVFYLSYVSKDMHIKQGDHVYVLRDHDTVGLEDRLYGSQYNDYEGPLRTPGTLYGNYTPKQLDIFQIERIFRDENNKTFVYGHHYLRPHETYHEPSRKFFPNEVLHMPLFESIPAWAVLGRCWVLDLKTFCKGRPRDAVEDHVYICDLKVDKAARMFSKSPKPKFPCSTKNFAFMWFDVKLKPVRNYQPHPSDYPGSKPNILKKKSEVAENESSLIVSTPSTKKKKLKDEEEVPLAKVRDEVKYVKLSQKMERLDRVAIRLLAKRATKEKPLDVSYLLERKRPKKKISVEVQKPEELENTK
ncbi:uncharacterized protein LOC136035184 isoform X2 [Artemia franciscana]|uniref:uncharacterized protein LOC136035184 isoform X2 n=1 Tax=Artemia franciscana TaxID=6661 RepID=UPI0032DA5B74